MSVEEKDKPQEQEEIIPVKVSVSDEFVRQMGEEYSKQIQQLAPQEQYTLIVNEKPITFKRRKILSKERMELEGLRQKLAIAATKDSGDYASIEDKLYKRMAQLYLIDPQTQKGMTTEQFDLTVYEDMKAVLNACVFRTERPIPSPFET